MRIDKYLKVSRLIKRRSLAKTMADNGRIKINGKSVKASHIVTIGDQLELQFGANLVKIEITNILDSTKKDDAKYMYHFIDKTKHEVSNE